MIKTYALILTSMLSLASAAASAQGLPGATVNKDNGAATNGAPAGAPAKGGLRERCQENPQQCAEMKQKMQARREQCKADPEKCRAERKARREERCKADPKRCEEMKAQFEKRRQECQANPGSCRPQVAPGPAAK